jgi:hypothetical protein
VTAPPIIAPAPAAMTWTAAGDRRDEIVREIIRAGETEQLDVFREGARYLGGLAREGWLPAVETGDDLYSAAMAAGIVNRYGDDKVQELLCDAFSIFERPPELNGHHHHQAEPPPVQSADEYGQHRISESAPEVGTAAPTIPWWRDPATIPPRQHLYDQHYMRRAIAATIAAGGRAKTTRGCYEAPSMTAGRDLATGEALPCGPLRVWLLNGEEDQDELDRRVAATCQHYGIAQANLGGRLFVQSVRDRPLRIATLVRGVPTLNQPVVKLMTDFIEQNRIDVFMLDPFVSFHGVLENDNMHMDLVIKEGLGAIANATNSAGEIFHHPGKPKPGQAETSVEDGRGASAILWAVRSARVLNFMTPDEAAKLGLSEDERKMHIRIANGKANMGPLGKAKWMKLVVENLPNGDHVAVSSPWTPPDPFAGVTSADTELARKLATTGEYRADSRSPKWFGYALAEQLSVSVSHNGDNDPKDLSRLKHIIKTWLKNNVLDIEERKDRDGKDRSFIVPGSFNPSTATSTYSDDEITLQ